MKDKKSPVNKLLVWILCATLLVAVFSLALPNIVTMTSSNYGVGAILQHYLPYFLLLSFVMGMRNYWKSRRTTSAASKQRLLGSGVLLLVIALVPTAVYLGWELFISVSFANCDGSCFTF